MFTNFTKIKLVGIIIISPSAFVIFVMIKLVALRALKPALSIITCREIEKIRETYRENKGSLQEKMQVQKQTLEQQQSQMQIVKHSGNISYSGSQTSEDKEEEMSRAALTTFQAREEEIERKKLEIREKVHAQLGRVEGEIKRLAGIREELEVLADPTRKEVAFVRKKIDTVNRELKPLGQSCQKKEKEYKDALETFNDKNKEKTQLISKLMELLSESERIRTKKLEELSKNINSYAKMC